MKKVIWWLAWAVIIETIIIVGMIVGIASLILNNVSFAINYEKLDSVAPTPIYAEWDKPEPPVASTPTYTEPKEKEWYTEADVVALARMVWGEARGVKPFVTEDDRTVSSKAQQAATIWCVLNRYDAGYANSIRSVVTAEGQFTGYRKTNPVTGEFKAFAEDVLNRWVAEKNGMVNVGRTLPGEYLFFAGKDGCNYFRIAYKGNPARWDWTLEDPYKEG